MVYVVITEVANIYKKKKKKSQINGTILIKKFQLKKTQKIWIKKDEKKNFVLYVTRSRVKVHTHFFFFNFKII